jgi:hypothetical protein
MVYGLGSQKPQDSTRKRAADVAATSASLDNTRELAWELLPPSRSRRGLAARQEFGEVKLY